MADSFVGRLLTPRIALLANAGLVIAGSVAGLLNVVDTVSAALIVLIGFLGIAIVVVGQRGS